MSNLQITGTIKSIGEVQTGTSKTTNKEWKKMDIFKKIRIEKKDNFLNYLEARIYIIKIILENNKLLKKIFFWKKRFTLFFFFRLRRLKQSSYNYPSNY